MDETNFYFGNLTFKQVSTLSDFDDLEISDRTDMIRKRIYEFVSQSDIIYRESDGYWRFGKCDKWDGKIIGKLGKIFTEERTTWNPEIEDYETVEEEIEVADVSLFIIDPDAEGIVFNRKLHTGSTKFAQAFAIGYNDFNELDDELEIDLLRTGGDRHYSEILREARRVYSIDFELEPVNPSANEEMEILDDHIKAMNANEMGLKAESDNGLNPEEEFLRSGFALSDDGGYGDYIIRYQRGDETETYDSRGDYATETESDPEDLDDLKSLAKRLIERLKDLISDMSEESE